MKIKFKTITHDNKLLTIQEAVPFLVRSPVGGITEESTGNS